MVTWLISRVLSYFTFIDFFDYLTDSAAGRPFLVKSYITPSEYVDIVDSAMPIGALILFEVLLLLIIYLLFYILNKLVNKQNFDIFKVASQYAQTLTYLGTIGIISRILTYASVVFFIDERYLQYNALPISFLRDIVYLLLGIVLSYISKNRYNSNNVKNELLREE